MKPFAIITLLLLALITPAAAISSTPIKERVAASKYIILGTVKKTEYVTNGEERLIRVTVAIKEVLKGKIDTEKEKEIQILQPNNNRNVRPIVGTTLIYFLKTNWNLYILALGDTRNSTAPRQHDDQVRAAVEDEEKAKK